MKKMLITTLTFVSLFFAFSLLVPLRAHAVDVLDPVCATAKAEKPTFCGNDNSTNPLTGNGGVFQTAVRILSLVAGISAVIVILVAGLRMILSSGDSNTVATSRKQIIYALVGIGLISVSNAVISLVINRV